MSGERELKIENKVNSFIDSMLDKVNSLKVIVSKSPENTDKLMNLSSEELRGMSEEECGIAATKLHQYASYIQQQYNRSLSTQKIIESYINHLISKEYDNYGDKYTKYDVKRNMILAGNSQGEQLSKLFLEAESLVDNISGLAYKISNIANSLNELQKSKRFAGKGDF